MSLNTSKGHALDLESAHTGTTLTQRRVLMIPDPNAYILANKEGHAHRDSDKKALQKE